MEWTSTEKNKIHVTRGADLLHESQDMVPKRRPDNKCPVPTAGVTVPPAPNLRPLEELRATHRRRSAKQPSPGEISSHRLYIHEPRGFVS